MGFQRFAWVLVAAGIALAPSARAGMVHGRVFVEGVNPPYTLQVDRKPGLVITTDRYGRYSLFLDPPDEYRVELVHAGRKWEGFIHSFPNAVGQDVHLRPIGR